MTSTIVTMDDTVPAGAVFAVDREKRVIRGLAVPYGVEGVKGGHRFMFSQGTIRWDDVSHVKLWVGHDPTQACGVAFELNDTPDGLEGAFRVARGPEGDRALTMAEDGVWDGMSVGPRDSARYRLQDGVHHAVDVPIREVSLTPAPVFTGARVRSVAFAHTKEQHTMPQPNESTSTDVNATTDTPTVPAPDVPAGFTELGTAIGTAVTQAIAAGFADLRNPQEREEVSAGRPPAHVAEPTPYRFDGIAGAHSFTDDMRASSFGDTAAAQRLEGFMGEVFAVTTANAGTLNPTQHRPDLFVPNLTFTRPLWEMVSTGSITDKTPFTIPKFGSATGLVGAHVEGVEPTPGAFTATSQTITPTPVSGKIELHREVVDQGGSPQVDAIVWGEMVNAYYEAIEAGIAAALNAVPTAELGLAGATDAALVDAMTDHLVALQFIRGGNRYTRLALDGQLFPALIGAADSTGRKLLPVIGPSNAQGTTEGAFDRVKLGNLTGRAAWALGTNAAAKSHLFVPSSVWAWASAPKRFTFEYQVKSVDLAIWGYRAAGVLRDSDVQPIDYTTADA